MKYDFTSIMDRKGKDATAVDAPGKIKNGSFFAEADIQDGFDIIPMWVADMNFPTVPSIPTAIIERAKHPAYGYFLPRKEYFEAIINWHKTRYGVEGLTAGNIEYANGVLGGVVAALKVLCSDGDDVLIQSPAYVGFTHAIEDNGWNLVLNPLKQDAKGIWRIDYEDLEEKVSKRKIHAAVFCSPHNPAGRVWERWEIEKMMEIYKKYDVFVVSDEIWADLVMPGYHHIPTQSVSEDARMRTIAAYAPSKTFNLAGLVGSYMVVYNQYLQDRMAKESKMTHYNNMNVLSMHALIGGYSEEGAQWVDELRTVLHENAAYAVQYIHEHFPEVKTVMPEGTYMMFLDCTEWCQHHGISIDEVQKRGVSVGIIWQDGRPFYGPCHIRLNLALPFSRVKEAFDRMDKYVFNR